jgi:prepilin peptidase CpaA
MNLLNSVPNWLAIILSLLLVAVAVQDTFQRKISNYLVLAVLILAVAAAGVVGPSTALWQNGVLFVLFLGVGMAVYAGGILGAGDIKLLAALALWCDLAGAPRFIAAVFITGGLLAMIMLIRFAIRKGPLDVKAQERRSVPYGVAIAGGALFIVWYGRTLGI